MLTNATVNQATYAIYGRMSHDDPIGAAAKVVCKLRLVESMIENSYDPLHVLAGYR